MFKYPALDEYNAAIQHPKTAFNDPLLQNGVIETTGLGIQKALGGGFAITHTISVGARKYAVRCFHKSALQVEHTYRKISSALHSDNSQYFVGFEYQPSGMLVSGSRYPIVKMDWAAGDTLGTWLEGNSRNSAGLQRLRRQFADLQTHLCRNSHAHGDLQNGNVIVNGGIRLIDYDGVYVPGLPVGKGTELGHKHFQHPSRSARDFGPDMDRFSFIVIDSSLQALIAAPALFPKYSNGENIIFTASDFLEPTRSMVFQELFSSSQLIQQAVHFAKVCAATINKVPILADFVAGRNIPAQAIIISGPVSKARSQSHTPYIGAFEVLDAVDFHGISLRVGDRVELIGHIKAVRNGRTKHGKPYVFLNFGDWRSSSTKVNIWSEGLIKLSCPDDTWSDRWVSVTGLVDPPYTNKRRGPRYTHYSITVTEPNQLRLIDEAEARRRLAGTGGVKSPGAEPVQSRNQDILAAVLSGGNVGHPLTPGTRPQVSISPGTNTSHLASTRNQQILAAITSSRSGPSKSLPSQPSTPLPSSNFDERPNATFGNCHYIWTNIFWRGYLRAVSASSHRLRGKRRCPHLSKQSNPLRP
jgi:hypothetical protein